MASLCIKLQLRLVDRLLIATKMRNRLCQAEFAMTKQQHYRGQRFKTRVACKDARVGL